MYNIPTGKRTYVLICGFSNVVAGGPIYHRNKLKYLEERGWRTVVISIGKAFNVRINGLEKYEGTGVSFLHYLPGEFSKSQFERKLDVLQSFIPSDASDIIIETGTCFSAYWGEALAARLKAKHCFWFIDEHFDSINKDNIGFYKFKYDRGELACIDKNAMYRLFKPYYDIPLEKCFSLDFECSNVVEDINHPFTTLIPKCDYNIGMIGRLEKGFVPVIIDGVKEFANQNSDKTIALVLFGGAFVATTVEEIKNNVSDVPNINLLISDYIFPLPLKALQKCDIFFSGAGSSWVTSRLLIPTVRMDVASFEPVGFIVDSDQCLLEKALMGNKVIDYLNQAFIQKAIPQIKAPAESPLDMWKTVCTAFDKHMELLAKSDKKNDYYNVRCFPLPLKLKVKKFIRSLFGLKISSLFLKSAGV